MKTIERYLLNTDTLPTIPTPHDCVVVEIKADSEFLTFVFEDELNLHDSIEAIRPSAAGLTIRFHKSKYYASDSVLYLRNIRRKRSGYRPVKLDELFRLTAHEDLEYLYHYVGYQCLIIKLWSWSCRNDIQLELSTDYVEFEWEDERR